MNGDRDEKTIPGGDEKTILGRDEKGTSGRDEKGILGRDENVISGRRVVLLHPTRSFRLRLSINHIIPGLVLLFSGILALREEGFRLLALAEIVAGAAVPTAVLIEFFKPEHKERGAVAWVEVFAGLMLVVEGAHSRRPGHFFQPALFYFLAGAIMLAFGFGSARLPRLRQMILDERGFGLRISPLHRVKVEWNAIAGYETTPEAIRLVMRGGRRRTVRLRTIENRGEVLREFTEFAKRYGVGIGVDEPRRLER